MAKRSVALGVLSVFLSATTSLVVAWRIQAVPALVLPVLASALPLFASSRRSRKALASVGALLLATFMVAAILSVGWFYLPVLLLLCTVIFLEG